MLGKVHTPGLFRCYNGSQIVELCIALVTVLRGFWNREGE